MTNEHLIAKFNPANVANLTAQDLLEMRALTDQQIDTLAKAYPNQPSRRAYLRLYDTTKPESKQIFNLSTWQNLRNVRKYSNMKNLVPYDFVATPGQFATQAREQISRVSGKASTSPKKVVVDLTAQEAAAELKANTKPAETPAPALKAVTLTPKPKNVENKATKPASVKPEKPAKSAASPKKAATGSAAKGTAANVENAPNSAGPDGSEQFPAVN